MFYGIATDKEGKNYIITNLSEDRSVALEQAKKHCLKNDLHFGGVYPMKNKIIDGGGIQYKFNKYRKKNGKMPNRYYEIY